MSIEGTELWLHTFLNSEIDRSESEVWLTVHLNSVWIRNQLDVTFVLSFISPLQVAQYVSGNHVLLKMGTWLPETC